MQTYLSTISGGEDPHGSSTLFHIPEEPQGGNFMGLRRNIHVDKQFGELTNSTWNRGQGLNQQLEISTP